VATPKDQAQRLRDLIKNFERAAKVGAEPVTFEGYSDRVIEVVVIDTDKGRNGGTHAHQFEFEPGDVQLVIAALKGHAL